MTSLTDLDSNELATRIADLVGRERNVQADFLLHLMEFDRRRDYLVAGYGSLWEYCQKKLGYPENATFRRTHAVRVLHRFPQAIDYLRDVRLSMTTLVLLESVLTEDSAERHFLAAFGRSKREVEEYLASLKAPVPVPAPTIRRVPSPVVEVSAAVAASPVVPEPASPARRPSVEPIAADQFRITMVVSGEFVATLKDAQVALSHSIPNGDVAAILRRGLAQLLEKHGKRVGTVPVRAKESAPTPRAPAPRPPSAARPGREPIPARVRRDVWRRDGGRCNFARPDGTNCGSRYQLELDHRVPAARGGRSTAANLRLRCSAHNDLHARQSFGGDWMDRVSGRSTFPGKSPANGLPAPVARAAGLNERAA